ncbi:NADH dehydrogenase [Arthrobacter sp. MN05-02]|nr:NADH dehydrogenase [Arthrobacter sp. MN05-02]
MSGTERVVVVGGGYAGVMAANRMAGSRQVHTPLEVTLVDPAAGFTERIRLHQLGAGRRASAAVPWTDVLNPRVRHLPARALSIDADRRTIGLAGREPLDFDWLVYAVGSGETSTSLLSVTNPEAARATRTAIGGLAPGSAVTVAGAGPTGVEVACAVALARPDLRITIVSPSGPVHPLTGHPAVGRRLRRLGIAVRSGAVDPATGAVTTPEGSRPAAPATIWTAGFAVPSLAADSRLPVAGDGRLLVDGTLTVPGHERILGAGDAVAVAGPAGAHLRASCATALPLGAHAADTVLARSGGGDPSEIDLGYVLQCLDLGSGQGHVRFVRPDDSPRPWALAGRAGGWTKEQICRMTVAWLAGEAAAPGSCRWQAGPPLPVG